MDRSTAEQTYARLRKDARRTAGIIGTIVGIIVTVYVLWKILTFLGIIPERQFPTTNQTQEQSTSPSQESEIARLKAEAEKAKQRAEKAKKDLNEEKER